MNVSKLQQIAALQHEVSELHRKRAAIREAFGAKYPDSFRELSRSVDAQCVALCAKISHLRGGVRCACGGSR